MPRKSNIKMMPASLIGQVGSFKGVWIGNTLVRLSPVYSPGTLVRE